MAAKKAADAVEAVATAEEILDAVDAIDAAVIVKKYGYAALAFAWVGGVAAGSLLTYLVAKKKLEAEYDERVAREVQESVDFLKTQDTADKVIVTDDLPDQEELPEDPDESVAEFIERKTLDYGTAETVQDPEPSPDEIDEIEGKRLVEAKPDPAELAKKNQTVAYHKAFAEQEEVVAQEAVAEAARVDEPDFEDVNPDISVISRDLFMTNISEYKQDTLTYFSDDAVLDLQGDFVPEHETLIGVGKPPFGRESEDANIVYLRNQKTEKEFEVIYDSGEAGEFLRHSLGEMYGRDHTR